MNRVLSIIGIIILILAIGAAFLFDSNIRKGSEAMGVNVLVAKEPIPEGFVIRDVSTVLESFRVARFTQNDVVPSAITVTGKKREGKNLWDSITRYFSDSDYELTAEEAQNLVGTKIVRDLFKNQQLLASDISHDLTEFAEGERLFAIPTGFQQSVGAEIEKGDYVDIWITYSDKDREGYSQKLLGPMRVIKLKDANNEEVKGNSNAIPQIVIVKASEEHIKYLSEQMIYGNLFMTKWGVTPTVKPAITSSSQSVADDVDETLDLSNEAEDEQGLDEELQSEADDLSELAD